MPPDSDAAADESTPGNGPETESVADEPVLSPEQAKKLFKALKARSTLKDVLKRYEGRMIGIDCQQPGKIQQARLIIAGNDHFVLDLDDSGNLYLFPYRTVFAISESADALLNGSGSQDEEVAVTVRLIHPPAAS